MAEDRAQYWKITFEGLVLDLRDQSFEGAFEMIDAFDDYGISILEQEQSEAKFDFWRIKVRLRVYRELPLYKTELKTILKDFDILSLRLSPECP